MVSRKADEALEFDSVIMFNGKDELGNLDGSASVDDEIHAEVMRHEAIDYERRLLT
jgi:hypothetical protein